MSSENSTQVYREYSDRFIVTSTGEQIMNKRLEQELNQAVDQGETLSTDEAAVLLINSGYDIIALTDKQIDDIKKRINRIITLTQSLTY